MWVGDHIHKNRVKNMFRLVWVFSDPILLARNSNSSRPTVVISTGLDMLVLPDLSKSSSKEALGRAKTEATTGKIQVNGLCWEGGAMSDIWRDVVCMLRSCWLSNCVRRQIRNIDVRD